MISKKLEPTTLIVLGADGSYAGPNGTCSGYLLTFCGTVIWLEAGPGTFSVLQRYITPGDIDCVFLSHEHPDHWVDIDQFGIFLLHFYESVSHSSKKLVLAPPGLRERSYFFEAPVFSWEQMHPSDVFSFGDNGPTASFVATDHGPSTLALRLDPTKEKSSQPSFIFSADTGPDFSLQELGATGSIALVEATYTRLHEGKHRHLSGHQAGQIAKESLVERLIVTHRWPSVRAYEIEEEAGTAFGRAVESAEKGLILDISSADQINGGN